MLKMISKRKYKAMCKKLFKVAYSIRNIQECDVDNIFASFYNRTFHRTREYFESGRVQNELYMKLYSHFTDEVKLNSKIVSFYSDGSGASLFRRDAEGAVLNADDEYLSTDYFIDAGYCHFAYLPKNFKLWSDK